MWTAGVAVLVRDYGVFVISCICLSTRKLVRELLHDSVACVQSSCLGVREHSLCVAMCRYRLEAWAGLGSLSLPTALHSEGAR